MKRFFRSGLFIILFISFMQVSVYAAVDMSVGGTVWYSWWSPAWQDGKIFNNTYIPLNTIGHIVEDVSDFKRQGNFLAGPMISLRFLSRWTVSSVFAIGKYHNYSSGPAHLYGVDTNLLLTPPEVIYKRYKRDILKWDSDTTIGFSVTSFMNIFVGFKYQGYRFEENMLDSSPSSSVVLKRDLTDSVHCLGSGLGVGFTIPLSGGFFMLANISGIVLWGFDKIETHGMYNTDGVTINPESFFYEDGRFMAYGGNSSLSLAYYIEAISTTISLGGRYQVLLNRQRYNNVFDNDVAMNILNNKYDQFFGITMSVVYTFSIGKKK